MVDLWEIQALHCVLGIFTELIPTRRTTRVAFWDLPSGSKNLEFLDWRRDPDNHQNLFHRSMGHCFSMVSS